MRLQTLAHIHLLLNHFPTVAFSLGVGLLIVAFFMKSDYMKRISLGIFLIISLISIPVYMTGKAAQGAIKDQPGVSAALTETHQDAALLAITFMEITGVLSWLGLWQFRRLSRASGGNQMAVMAFSVLTFVLMARASYMGGEIRHPEINAQETDPANPADPADPPDGVDSEWIRASSIAGFVNT